MPEIISNTSCLIVLDNIGMLDILKELYGKIIITRQVKDEFGKNIPEWIEQVTTGSPFVSFTCCHGVSCCRNL